MTRKRYHGEITEFELGSDRRAVVPTFQCGHCGGHFPLYPGRNSGYGWCGNCCRATCGEDCQTCVPTELLLENLEKGRPWDYRPVVSPGS